ncbi:MAG TPA: hypothetical protein VJX67_12845 [Blastocatellia bacterium]|nr:hypothetical protein [Blastocatellia bacterium]
MIQNQEQLERTRSAIANLERALQSLKRDVLPKNPKRFALMAEPDVADIRRLRADVDEYIGVTAAISEEAQVWMRLKGPGLESDQAPASIVSSTLKTLSDGILAIAEFTNRRSGNAVPSGALKHACDLEIVAWVPGSIQLGLRLPEAPLREGKEEARLALTRYLEAAEWVGSEAGPEQYQQEMNDAELGGLLLKQVNKLLPKPGDLESVEIAGRFPKARRTAILRRKSKGRIRQAIRLLDVDKNAEPRQRPTRRQSVRSRELLTRQSEQGDRSLMDFLGEIPDEIFFSDTGHPNFNEIFVEVARRIYAESGDQFSIPVHDFLTGKLPNLTSFQRAVTKERQRREG